MSSFLESLLDSSIIQWSSLSERLDHWKKFHNVAKFLRPNKSIRDKVVWDKKITSHAIKPINSIKGTSYKMKGKAHFFEPFFLFENNFTVYHKKIPLKLFFKVYLLMKPVFNHSLKEKLFVYFISMRNVV